MSLAGFSSPGWPARLDNGRWRAGSADASIMMPMEFSRLIVAALFGFILFAEIPSIYTAAGGMLIFGSTVYIAQREARLSKQRAASTPTQE